MTGAGRARTARAWIAAILIAPATIGPALALEQPPSLNEADLRLGAPLNPQEQAEAQQFCRETLAGAAMTPPAIEQSCACFPRAWEVRTHRLHRLALPIAMDPASAQSRRDLAVIFRAQHGIDEGRLKQLSAEYQAAARQAFAVCR